MSTLHLTTAETLRLAAALNPSEAIRAAARTALDEMQAAGEALLREPHRPAPLVLNDALARAQRILDGGL